MRHFSPGLSDSIASVIADPAQCPHCDSSSCIGGGLCVGCLLQTGLAADDECAPETLLSALAEITLPDKNWRLGNYEILEEIGRGGMGVIYRARQRHSRRIVAVKRVLGYHADSRETLARFRREAQAAASLDHPNILPIYEVSESEDGLPFFSMKFAPGGNLQEVGPALRNDPRQCVALVAKISRAVQYAHSKGILHRDLKPGNILLDAHGEPLVSDFGLAKWLDTTSDLTRTLTIFGTPGYIAPEQASGPAAELKPAADVYSLGAILFDLLAGRPPFLGSHALSVIRQAAELPAPKLRTLSKVADRDLETICSRCLERDPTARYPSAHDLAEDLERWLEGRPIIARPVSQPTKVWRWAKRNRRLAITAGSCAVLAVLTFTAFLSRERLGSIVRSEAAAARSVGVIPFEDLDEAETAAIAAETINNRIPLELARLMGPGVAGTKKTSPGPDAWNQEERQKFGRELGVRNIVTGMVRRRARTLRAVVQLTDVVSGTLLRRWVFENESEETMAADIATVVSAVIQARARRETVPLTPHEIADFDFVSATSKPLAKSYYLSARELRSRLNVTDFDRAIALFEKAIDEDPSYAAAYAMLASACQSRSELDPSGPWLAKGNVAAATAIKLAPTLAEAQRAQAGILRYQGQLRASLDGYLTAYELDPSNDRAAATIGNVQGQLGRPDLALRWYEKAVRRETRPGIYSEYIGRAWTDLGEELLAEKAFRAAMVFRPDLPGAEMGIARLALLKGDFGGAREQCESAQQKFPDDWELKLLQAEIEFYARRFEAAEQRYSELMARESAGKPLMSFSAPIRFNAALGFIRNGRNDQVEGRRLLHEAQALDLNDLKTASDNPRLLYSLAAGHAALGETTQALEQLQCAVANGWIDYRALVLDPRFDSIRETSQFTELSSHLYNKVRSMDAIMAGRNSG
jgi:Tfp pilus assembly protein PilF/TolB-like protein/tRNA A-37 threonylcarbamoyl transferase component Bud32